MLAAATKLLQTQLAEAELMALCRGGRCTKEDLKKAIRICKGLGVRELAVQCARDRLEQIDQEVGIDEEWMLSLAKNVYEAGEPHHAVAEKMRKLGKKKQKLTTMCKSLLLFYESTFCLGFAYKTRGRKPTKT